MHYTISPDAAFAAVEDGAVVLHMGTKRGAFVWRRLEDGIARAEIVAQVVTEYDVGIAEAEMAAARLLEELAQESLIRAAEAPWMERAMAAAATVVVPVALRVLPLRTTLALCDAWPRTPGARATPAALARRVDRWLARGRALWRPTCLTRTIVLYAMLRQHGHIPRLHIGALGPANRFQAHAWLSLGDTALAEFDRSLTHYRDLVTHGA